jgi:hypothetical protein
MLTSPRKLLAFGAACVSLSVLSSAALGAGPAKVIVRVEGQNETLLAATRVTTTTEPVVKDGNPQDSCPGTSALGALQLATGGNWSGPWDASFKQYEIYAIEGESHPFGSGFFWDIWINHAESGEGACLAEPEEGAEVLFFPCSESASACPNPLGVEAPPTANVGAPVSVTVVKYSVSGTPSPVSGATVGVGANVQTTEASGHATLVFAQAGEQTIRVSAPELVRTEATICVHNGNDGTCGTTAQTSSPSSSASSGSSATAEGGGVSAFSQSKPAAYSGPDALVAKAHGLIEGHVYTTRHAPRLLSGSVHANSPVTSISLELRRSYRGRCYAYNASRERFVRARCGKARPFKVSSDGTYSYLLPARLGPGRYVLDILATDVAGNHTTPARGSSRIVFYVR